MIIFQFKILIYLYFVKVIKNIKHFFIEIFFFKNYIKKKYLILIFYIIEASRNKNGDGKFIIDDYREAYYWLRQNTKETDKIMSWWDYGYQITGLSNRTVIVDNNTWNNTHIATVGLVFIFILYLLIFIYFLQRLCLLMKMMLLKFVKN